MSTSCILALVLIAFLGLLANEVHLGAIRESDGIAAVINESGRQRMLTQLIGSLATQYWLGDESAKRELLAAMQTTEAAHRELSAPYRVDAAGPGAERELHRLYFEGPEAVDSQETQLLTAAKEVAGAAPHDAAVEGALHQVQAMARGSLPDRLNQIVMIHQRRLEARIALLKQLVWSLYVLLVGVLALEWLLLFRPMTKRIREQSATLLEMVVRDGLTGVLSRAGFYERAHQEFRRAERYGRELTVVLMDVDNFKGINDTHGHFAGDDVLRELGRVLLSGLRPSDVVGRLGGEEFGVVLTETGVAGAAMLAERLRESIANIRVMHHALELKVTASFGVCGVKFEAGGLEAALKEADDLLYQAKRTGRNRVSLQSVEEGLGLMPDSAAGGD